MKLGKRCTLQTDQYGTKRCYRDGKLHRIDGPAVQHESGGSEWYENGLRHREDGPAYISHYGTKQWYLHGVCYTEENFNRKLMGLELLPIPMATGPTGPTGSVYYGGSGVGGYVSYGPVTSGAYYWPSVAPGATYSGVYVDISTLALPKDRTKPSDDKK